MPTLRLARELGLMTALVSLAGCTGGIRYPNYYVLNLPAPVQARGRAAPMPGSVTVREFDAPRFLKAGAIVYRESAEQLAFYDYHRWAVEPRRAVTRAIVQQVEARGIFRSVHSSDNDDGQTPDYVLSGTLDHLEEVDQGSRVSVEAGLSARLIDTHTGGVLWQGALSKTVQLEQRSVPGVVTEMSGAMQSVVVDLVSSMEDRISATSSTAVRSGPEE